MHSSIDITLLEWIQNQRIESLDWILYTVSSTTTYVSIGIVLLIGIAFRFHKEGLRKMVQVGLAIFLTALITFAIKSIVKRPRPFKTHETIEKLSQGGGASFPSGHTFEAFAVATSLSLLFRRRLIQIPAFSWALLVAYSRMALGVHYPSDVLGGLLIGIILAFGIDYGFKRWISPP
jgi:undecaprenyl-diphosphatase